MDISDSLHTYKVEYQVFQDDLQTAKSDGIDGSEMEEDLVGLVTTLKERNYLLNKKLQSTKNQLHDQVLV